MGQPLINGNLYMTNYQRVDSTTSFLSPHSLRLLFSAPTLEQTRLSPMDEHDVYTSMTMSLKIAIPKKTGKYCITLTYSRSYSWELTFSYYFMF